MKRINVNTDKLESYDIYSNEYEEVLSELFDCGDYIDNGDAFAGFIGSRVSSVDMYDGAMEVDYTGIHSERQMVQLANDIAENLFKDELRPFRIGNNEFRVEKVTYEDENENGLVYCVCPQPRNFKVCIYFFEKPA